MRLLQVSGFALVVVLLSGCSVSLRTAPAAVEVCDAGLQSGQLVASANSGLALRDGAGGVIEVLWPFGYTARRGAGGIELIGLKGEVLGREGDFIEAGGGSGNEGVFAACDGTVRVVPRPG